MAARIGINGFGRIGRNFFRALRKKGSDLEVVAINDLFDTQTNAHLLRYDSNYGTFGGTIEAKEDALIVNGKRVDVTAERDWTKLRWGERGVDLVIESTGVGTNRPDAAKHLEANAKKVIISAPAKEEDITIVLGVNQDKYDPATHNIISNASCTTNGLAPVVKVVFDSFGIEKGMMTTVHAYTNSQKILDLASKDLREARAAALNIVPTTTGAARAVALVIPEVKGIVDGLAYRVPTPTVSIVEFVAVTKKETTKDEVNAALRKAAGGPMKGILDVTDEPLVSLDFNGDVHSATVDAELTSSIGDLATLMAWYDNEAGYSQRLFDLAAFVASKL